MAARKLKLTDQEWSLGAQIGDRSGFGKVYEARADDGTEGVVKLIPKEPGAQRELLFEELSGVPNIVPIIDTGETADDWIIAMPRADRSLRAELDSAGGSLSLDRALPILIDVLRALAAIEGRVVHRDIKPENVLLLNGEWCVADFGIARYAEASTAADTRKAAWTPQYAAPERWRFEHATSSTDIYSFGIMGFELLMGELPFGGPSLENFRRQHTEDEPPAISAPAVVASALTECMFKAAGSRPRAANVMRRLQDAQDPGSPALARLQAANEAIQGERASEQARESAAQSQAERRRALFETSKVSLEVIAGRLRQTVLDNASAATAVAGTQFDDWAVQLGTATIGMDPATLSDPGSWGAWRPALDVVAYAAVGIIIPPDRHEYAGRAHSLFYCDAQDPGSYRWYETAFMVSPLIARRAAMDPFAFAPSENAGKALSAAMAEWQVAWPFTPIDQGDDDEFIERWLGWFAQAAQGQLQHPTSMPERPIQNSWRM